MTTEDGMVANRGKFVRDLMEWEQVLFLDIELIRELNPPDEFKEQYEDVREYVLAARRAASEARDAIGGLLKAMGKPTLAERKYGEGRRR